MSEGTIVHQRSRTELLEYKAQSISVSGQGKAAAVTGVQGAHNVYLANAQVNVAGRDNHNHTHSHTHAHVHTHVHQDGAKYDPTTVLDLIANFRKVQQDMLAKTTPGTVEWIFKVEYFSDWWDKGAFKVLWGSGIPGAGKTILVSIVINEIEHRAKAVGGAICVAYFYLRYNEHAELTVRGVLEVLVKQTVERHRELLSLAHEVYGQHARERTQPTERELLGLLWEFISRKSVTCYFLDALDEAPIDIQLDLVQKLTSLNALVFITSRPMKDVQACVPEARCFDISAQEDDLDLYIKQRLQSSPRFQALLRGDAATRKLVMDTVKRSCDGMFLHASLQLNALLRCSSLHSIMKTLDRFPVKIEYVYEQTWKRITDQNPEHAYLAQAALLWVLHAKRPLTMEELSRAIATCPDNDRFEGDRLLPHSTILDICHGLVILEGFRGHVRLIHYTAKPIIEKFLCGPFPHPHPLLASVCMAHLTCCGFQNTKTVHSREQLQRALESDPLLAYAHESWAHHAQQSLGLETAVVQISDFIAGCLAFPLLLSYGVFFDLLGPLHIIAFYNLPVTLAVLCDTQALNIQTRNGKATPLIIACARGHHAVAQNLLSFPDLLVNLTDDNGDTAIMHAACNSGNKGIVELLLARPDIEVNLAASRNGGSALIYASRKGCEGILKLLLARPEIVVNSADSKGDTPLIIASQEGYEGIVKLLLARPGIEVNLAGKHAGTALIRATESGYEGIVRSLLAHPDIDVNLAPHYGTTALLVASRWGREGIVKLLLVYPGIKVNSANHYGATALSNACCFGHTGIVKLLLAVPDVDINTVDRDGKNPAKLAAENGHEHIARMLWEVPGINITAAGARGDTLASIESSSGCRNIAQLLQDFQFDNQNTLDGREGREADPREDESTYGSESEDSVYEDALESQDKSEHVLES